MKTSSPAIVEILFGNIGYPIGFHGKPGHEAIPPPDPLYASTNFLTINELKYVTSLIVASLI